VFLLLQLTGSSFQEVYKVFFRNNYPPKLLVSMGILALPRNLRKSATWIFLRKMAASLLLIVRCCLELCKTGVPGRSNLMASLPGAVGYPERGVLLLVMIMVLAPLI